MPEPRSAGRLKYVLAGEIEPEFMEPGLVDGLLDDKGVTIVYGPSGAGKTAVVVDLACRIAAGQPWRTLTAKQGLVVYVAAENSESTRRRVWAWRKAHGHEGELALAVVQSPVTLGPDAVKEIVVLAAQVEVETGQKVRLVVFDTLARTLGGDENTAKDMGSYVAALDAIKDALNCHVLVVHHTGKDEGRGARGSSALKAAADHEIEVIKEQESKIGTIRLTKVREGELEGQRFGYALTPTFMGRNKLGRDMTTVVAMDCAAPAKGSGGKISNALEAAEAYIEAEGGRVTVEELKIALGDISNGKPDAERKAWSRVFAGLTRLPGGYLGLGGPDRSVTDTP